MFSTHSNHYKGSSSSNSSFLKKSWHFLDLVCSIHVVTITTGLSYIVTGVASKSCIFRTLYVQFWIWIWRSTWCPIKYSQLRLRKNYIKSLLWQNVPSVTVDCTWWDIRGFSSCLIKWPFLDLVYSVHVEGERRYTVQSCPLPARLHSWGGNCVIEIIILFYI